MMEQRGHLDSEHIDGNIKGKGAHPGNHVGVDGPFVARNQVKQDGITTASRMPKVKAPFRRIRSIIASFLF